MIVPPPPRRAAPAGRRRGARPCAGLLARAAVGLAAALPCLALPRVATAQAPRAEATPQWEARLDAALSPDLGALGGIGVNVRAGWYARVGLAATAGAVRDGTAWQAAQRLDFTARFLFDPFAESRRAFYAGAGLGVVRVGEASPRPLLLGVVGVEGEPTGRVVPSLELTLGGGARLGVVLRRPRAQGR